MKPKSKYAKTIDRKESAWIYGYCMFWFSLFVFVFDKKPMSTLDRWCWAFIFAVTWLMTAYGLSKTKRQRKVKNENHSP